MVQVVALGPLRFKLNSELKFGGQYVYMENATPELRLIQEIRIKSLIRNVVIISLVLSLSFATCGMRTCYLYVFEGIRITFLDIKLPFVDDNSEFGFWVNILYQIWIAFMGWIGCLAIEIGSELICNGVSTVPQLIHIDVEQLESEMHLNGFTTMAKARLRNIFMKVQDYQE